ncbi:hypothetical protein HK405_002567 [Cladochytrium tenue]|nr:hypothetical protein HK405_002567 [Cladochytrium tenue]
MTPGSGASASSPRARPLLLVLLGVLIVGMITLLATSASQQRPHSAAAPRTGGSLLGVGGDMLDLAVGDVEYGAGSGAAAGAAAAAAGGAKDEAYVPAKVRKPVDPMMSKMGNETLKWVSIAMDCRP